MGKETLKILKIKVYGRKFKVTTPPGEKNELQELDREVQLMEAVFKCLSKIDKSVGSYDENEISIDFQHCPMIAFAGEKEFCRKAIKLMERDLTKKMRKNISIYTGGFIDYSEHTEHEMLQTRDPKFLIIFWLIFLVVVAIVLLISR